jgi:hypothetical protein
MDQPPAPNPSNPPPRGGNPLRWIMAYTRGLIYNQHLRRLTMFYSLLGALLMFFVGDMFLEGWLRERLQRFAVYWLICAWLTVLAALLAIFDLLMLRLQHRLERRLLREKMLDSHREGEETP